MVVFEAKSLWRSATADVDFGLDLSSSKSDAVVFDKYISAGDKARKLRLLQNAKNPFARIHDGVADKLCSIDADKGCCTNTPLDGVVSHNKASRFILGTLRAEVSQASRTAEIDRTLTRVCKVAFFDNDIARAALELMPALAV